MRHNIPRNYFKFPMTGDIRVVHGAAGRAVFKVNVVRRSPVTPAVLLLKESLWPAAVSTLR